MKEITPLEEKVIYEKRYEKACEKWKKTKSRDDLNHVSVCMGLLNRIDCVIHEIHYYVEE